MRDFRRHQLKDKSDEEVFRIVDDMHNYYYPDTSMTAFFARLNGKQPLTEEQINWYLDNKI